VLLDSGNYEAFWLRDTSWTFERYLTLLQEGHPFFELLGFDSISDNNNSENYLGVLASRIEQCQKKLPLGTSVIPIIHGAPDTLAYKAVTIAHLTGIERVAVPERELGTDIIAQTAAISAISAQCKIKRDVRLHILGTGNPIALILFALAGAETFDGLEWCKTTIDPIFPDQTARFLKETEALLNSILLSTIHVSAPLMQFTKKDVVKLAKERGIKGTYSCHKGNAKPCGKCIACLEYNFNN
jgi:hypothetical protein